ncbi:MAG TPA: hypothetical protein VEA69_19440 [Tepidisphaeraceae bacterium]|nr:hypothetical protein [Tepidisphaeraceae bacterium]
MSRCRPARPFGRAYSLVEMVLCMVVFSIILLAVQSAVRFAGRAVPDGRSTASAAALGAQALDTLAYDLTYATAVTPGRATAADLEFTVPDRNGDGVPETIRYRHAAGAGTLSRQVNGGSAVTMATNVGEFSLAFDTRAKANPQTASESPEVVLSSYDPLLTLTAQRINSGVHRGQYFVPAIPGNATSWRVTRVMLKAAAWGSSNGETLVQLRTASGGLPTSTVVDQASLFENTLTAAYAWKTLTYANAGGLNPADGLCIVLKWVSDSDSCGVQYVTLLALAPNAALVRSTDGVTWTSIATDDLIYYVYGTYSTPDPVTYSYALNAVRCAIRLGADANARCETTARTVNQPTVPGP